MAVHSGLVGTLPVTTPDPTPTPEPATMLLMGTGLTGLSASRKKKKA
ncbi:MAG: PEP-CTERM sorting domain-containing protein [Proteobacteria bacterium]|nr:PEP-CTERM sorting domain-containing protein [Desulfobulbaceae bacterium]MBU4154469.1 PEP-CTERM sorting domain-containing protein [Pseudomonadota bacterium]